MRAERRQRPRIPKSALGEAALSPPLRVAATDLVFLFSFKRGAYSTAAYMLCARARSVSAGGCENVPKKKGLFDGQTSTSLVGLKAGTLLCG